MSRHAYKVCTEFFRINGNFAESLNCVCMADNIRFFPLYRIKNLCNRHNGTRFVIHIHNRNKNCIIVYFRKNILGMHNSVLSWAYICNLKALLLKSFARLHNTAVLNGSRNNLSTSAFFCICSAEKSKVISLRTAACKDDFIGLGKKLLSNRLSRLFKLLFRKHSSVMK